jgi:hypothetical protein
MTMIKPDGESRPGLISTRDCRIAFRIDDRNLRRAINTGRLPIYIVNEKPMIDPADAVALVMQSGRRYGK